MGPRDTTGASLARLRALRGAFNETQVKDASERWRHARSSGGSWRTSPSEHSTLARALELLASRATEGVQAKGAPSRGGPVRAEVAAALRAPGSLESIATLVSSPNRDASRRACHALDALLHLLSSATSARPCASLAVALADRAARADADPDAALAAASALLRLNPAAHDAVVDALRDADAAAVAAERLARFARENLTVSVASPAALVVAALAPRAELFHRSCDSPAFAEGLLALASSAANDGASRVAVAALDAAAEMTVRDVPGFYDALCPRDGSHSRAAEAARALACAEGPNDARARGAAFRLVAAVAANLPPPPSRPSDEARRWTGLARACVRGVRAFAATIRGEDVRGDSESFFSSASFATTATARLLAPTTRGFGDPPPPPPPWRATLLAAGVAGALREVAESWVAAWTTRALPGGHRLDSPFSVAAADAFVAVARLANPGDAPTLAPFDVAALARACVAAAALVAPRAARRDEALASILRDGKTDAREDASEKKNAFVAAAGCAAGNLVAETVGREAAVAVCQLMDCEERGEGGGASRGEGGGRGAADGASSSAALSSAVSSAASSELDAATRAFGGNEWTRRVALHLSLDAWVTPAKATLAAALARRPSSREALRGAGATERVAETLARLTRNAAKRAEASFAARRGDDDDDDDGGGGGREGGSHVDRSRSRAEVDLDDPDVDLPPRSVFDDDAFAPLAWRPGEASLVASCVRALAELARDADAADAAAIRIAVPALAATVRALASEEAAESLGGGLGEETRCWATLATRCLRAPPGVRSNHWSNGRTPSTDVDVDIGIGSVAWGKVAVAAALADALPATYAGDVEDGDDDDAETAAASAASPAAAPNVVFRHATGERTPAHAAILAARCPALLRGVDAADADRRDGSSSPGTTVRVARLGAGVTARALRVALTWAYSGATAIDFAAIDDATSDEASTLAAVARSCSLRDLDATLRARRPALGARVGALTRDLDALVRPTARHSDLRLEAQDAVRGKDGHDGDVDDVDAACGDDSTVELSAHAVVMCARSAYCRAALSPTHGFAESAAAAVSSSTRATLRLPVSTPSALAALRDACYSGVFPRPTRRGDGSWASVAVELAAALEYLTMDAEAEACASRLTRAMRDASWRETVGVEAATDALARATTLRRWAEAEAIADAVADAYPEAAKTTAFETLGEEMREAMRKAHVARARMGG